MVNWNFRGDDDIIYMDHTIQSVPKYLCHMTILFPENNADKGSHAGFWPISHTLLFIPLTCWAVEREGESRLHNHKLHNKKQAQQYYKHVVKTALWSMNCNVLQFYLLKLTGISHVRQQNMCDTAASITIPGEEADVDHPLKRQEITTVAGFHWRFYLLSVIVQQFRPFILQCSLSWSVRSICLKADSFLYLSQLLHQL